MITFCVMFEPRNTMIWSSSILESFTVVWISIPVFSLSTPGVQSSLLSLVLFASSRALFSASSMTWFSSRPVTNNGCSPSGNWRRNRLRRFASDSDKFQSIKSGDGERVQKEACLPPSSCEDHSRDDLQGMRRTCQVDFGVELQFGVMLLVLF